MIKRILLYTSLLSLLILSGSTFSKLENQNLDVDKYTIDLTLDMENKSIAGELSVRFSTSVKQAIFNCGSLQVESVSGDGVVNFQQQGNQLIVSLSGNNTSYLIYITYTGSPTKGLFFSGQEVYTNYFTEEWMVCNMDPQDKARLELNLTIPDTLNCVASGSLAYLIEYNNNHNTFIWIQNTPAPAYTYGFAIGPFKQYQEKYKAIELTYYSSSHSMEELKNIFGKTPDMIAFFENKSGIPYFQQSYSQVLIGNHYQEMSGFSVLKNTYGSMVLKDSTETNLISHELAHQWWGNLITCKTWNHFWLNEGFATYMSAAYNEHRFGKEKYNSDIASYRKVYEGIKEKGLDKPLVFSDWSNPTKEDRNLVYFKGAYVLHLLRQKLGDELFWKAIKEYSVNYYGRSVVTEEFQVSVESSTGKDLDAFFKEWIY